MPEQRRGHALLKPGDIAPDFALHTADGQPVSLKDTLRDGRNVLLAILHQLENDKERI
jgi:peroxiredoxin